MASKILDSNGPLSYIPLMSRKFTSQMTVSSLCSSFSDCLPCSLLSNKFYKVPIIFSFDFYYTLFGRLLRAL